MAAAAKQGYDLKKLAKAVAIHETGNCTAKVGSARYNNCHGYRVHDQFLHFKTKDESYAKFYELWPSSYGDAMPSLADATVWVCGGQWLRAHGAGASCPGGSPVNWLSSVKSIYATL